MVSIFEPYRIHTCMGANYTTRKAATKPNRQVRSITYACERETELRKESVVPKLFEGGIPGAFGGRVT